MKQNDACYFGSMDHDDTDHSETDEANKHFIETDTRLPYNKDFYLRYS